MGRTSLIQPNDSPFKNHFMNGSMNFWQRNTTFTSFEGKLADRFSVGYATSGGRATWSREASIIPPNLLTKYSMKAQTSIIDAAPAAAALGLFRHRIEGNYFKALKGKTFFLKGKIYTNVTGSWTIGFANNTEANRWLDQINVPVANTWTDFILDVTHNPAIGAWNYDENSGLVIAIPVVAGTSHQTAASNKRNWNIGSGWVITGSANQNFHSSLSNVLYLAQLQIVTNPDEPFQPMGGGLPEEHGLCQRYLEKSYDIDVVPGTVTPNGYTSITIAQQETANEYRLSSKFAVTKRVAPSITIYNPSTGAVNQLDNGATANLLAIGQQGFTAGKGPATVNSNSNTYHWVADADF